MTRASLQGVLAAILIFGAAQESVSAVATPGAPQPEKRGFHYLFVPNRQLATGKQPAVHATAIVRVRREFKLILDFGNGSWLTYLAQSDLHHCTSHDSARLSWCCVRNVDASRRRRLDRLP